MSTKGSTRRAFLSQVAALGACMGWSACTGSKPDVSSTPEPLEPAKAEQIKDVVLLTDTLITGGLFARTINQHAAETGVRLMLRRSNSTEENLRAVANGDAPLGFSQSQILYDAQIRDVALASTRGKLRIVCSLYEASCTLLALPSSGIAEIADLVGKRVILIERNTTDRITLGHLCTAIGLTLYDSKEGSTPPKRSVVVLERQRQDIKSTLEAGEADAFFSSLSHPSLLIGNLLARTAARPVPIVVPLDKLTTLSTGYIASSILTASYPELSKAVDVATVGSLGLLITSTDVPPEVITGVLQGLWNSIDALALLPLFRLLSQKYLIDGLPKNDLHAGAAQFFTRQGLSNSDTLARAFTPNLPSNLGYATAQDANVIAAALSAIVGNTQETPKPEELPVDTILNRIVIGTMGFGLLNENVLLNLRKESQAHPTSQTPRSLRAIARLPGPVVHLVASGPPKYPRRNDLPPITRVEDLAGRNIGVGDEAAAHVLTQLTVGFVERGLVAPHAFPMAPELLLRAMGKGEISAFILTDYAPSIIVEQALRSTPPGRLIPFAEALSPSIGWAAISLPETTYRSPLPGPYKTLTEPFVLLTHSEMPVDRVRAIADAMAATGPNQLTLCPQASDWKRDWLFQNLVLPLHPGLGDYVSSAPEEVTSQPLLLLGAGDPMEPAFFVAALITQLLHGTCSNSATLASGCVSPFETAILPTDGEFDNIERLIRGEISIGFARGDIVMQAISGTGAWKDRPQATLRGVCTLYTVSMTVLVTSPEHLASKNIITNVDPSLLGPRDEQLVTPIRDLKDVEGRRISIRQDLKPTPRTNAMTMFRLDAFISRQWVTALQATEPTPDLAFKLFESGDVDALFWMVAHPNSNLYGLIQRCPGSHIVGVTGIDRDLSQVPSAERTLIDVSYYEDSAKEHLLPSIGIPLMLITTTAIDDALIQSALSILASHISVLREGDALLSQFSLSFMEPRGFIERHPAAERFFREALAH